MNQLMGKAGLGKKWHWWAGSLICWGAIVVGMPYMVVKWIIFLINNVPGEGWMELLFGYYSWFLPWKEEPWSLVFLWLLLPAMFLMILVILFGRRRDYLIFRPMIAREDKNMYKQEWLNRLFLISMILSPMGTIYVQVILVSLFLYWMWKKIRRGLM